MKSAHHNRTGKNSFICPLFRIEVLTLLVSSEIPVHDVLSGVSATAANAVGAPSDVVDVSEVVLVEETKGADFQPLSHVSPS
jgi:hypothetical protein